MKKRRRVEQDVRVRYTRGSEPLRRNYALLEHEHEEGWEARARTHLSRTTCEKISQLIDQELKLNHDVLADMAAFLLAPRAHAVQGKRLPAAVMQSHMGATVDRQVYQPRLRELLRPPLAELSVVVPVSSVECHVVADALALVGGALWTEYQGLVRRNQRLLSRHARSSDTAFPKVPSSVNSLRTICSLAETWRELALPENSDPSRQQPVHVMLLFEDFASVERGVLKALFGALAAAQFDESWGRGQVSFSVVLWASAAVDLRADLLDHLYLIDKPFLPAPSMLGNVLLAFLVEPQLPFVLPLDVFTWLVEHFDNESHSLAWLLHVLHALVFDFFSQTDGSWALQPLQAHEPPGLVLELRRLLPSLRNLSEDSLVRQGWLDGLEQWNAHRSEHALAVVELWRILRILAPRAHASLLDFVGQQLRFPSWATQREHVVAVVREALLSRDAADFDLLEKSVFAELETLRAARPDAVQLERAQRIMEEEEGVAEEPEIAEPIVSEMHDLDTSNAAAVLKPAAALQRSISVGGLRTLRSTGAIPGGGRRAVLLPERMSAMQRKLLRVAETLLIPLRAPEEGLLADLNRLGRYRGSRAILAGRLLGHSHSDVLEQLRSPTALKCRCCATQSAAHRIPRRKSRSGLMDRVDDESDGQPDPHEDVCIAYQVVMQTNSNGEVRTDQWESLFLERIGLSNANGRARFKRAFGDLQCLGIVRQKAKTKWVVELPPDQ